MRNDNPPTLLHSRLINRKRLAAAATLCAVIALSGCAAATAPPATTASSSASPTAPGGPGKAAGGSNARSGPATGGSSGTVGSVSATGFTLTTPAGQAVTVTEASATTYLNGSSPATASDVTAGESVLVLGMTTGTTITADQVIVQPTGDATTTSYTPTAPVPFKQGAPSAAHQDGQIPTNYTEGSGTIVSGAAANSATIAALAAYPGGVVDRVVQLDGGEYEVHYIGVNWPHHIFVSTSFIVDGAN